MNPTAIYSKSGKGVQEASGKTSLLPRADRAVLSAIDGRANLAEVAAKVGKSFDAAFQALIVKMDKDGFVREVSAGAAPAAPAAPKPAAVPGGKPAAAKPAAPAGGGDFGDLDFSSLTPKAAPPPPAPKPAVAPPPRPAAPPPPPPKPAAPPPPPSKAMMEQTTTLARAREEAEARAQAERERLRAEVEAKTRTELEAKMRAEAEKKMKDEASSKATAEAEAKVKAAREAALRAAEAKVKIEAEAKAKLEAERKAREETERRLEEERQAREAAERKAKEEAERARKEAEEKARREAEELRKRLEEERKAREEAERKAKEEAERVRRELEEERKRLEAERKREEEERAARKKREEEEAEARRKAREEEERKAEEERAARRKLREEEEDRKADEERAAKRKQRDEEEERERQEKAAREAEREAKRRKEEEQASGLLAAAAARAATQAAAPKAPPKKEESFGDSLLADLDSFSNKDEEERKAREEEERKAKAEAQRRQREEAERQAKEEAERKAKEEAERARKEEEARREREEEDRRAQEEERRKRDAEEIRRKATAATAAAMAKEGKGGPKSQAPADDIPISDDDLHDDEIKKEQAALAKTQAKEKEKEKERERAAKKAEPPPRPRKPVKWGPMIGTMLFILILVGLIAIHVMPVPVADIERSATEALGRPVKIGSARYWIFTGPQIRFSDVRIGDAKISHIAASVSPGSMFSQRKDFSRLEIDDLALPQEALAEVLFATLKADNLTIERIVVKSLELPGPAVMPKGLQAEATLDGKGALRAATVRGPDGLVAKIVPKEGSIDFDVLAAGFTLPIAPEIVLSKFGMKGSATPRGMKVDEWGGAIYNGGISGTANIRWGSTWTVEGAVTVRGINAAVFAPTLLSGGTGEGSGRFTMTGNDPAKLAAGSRLDGNFTVTQGTLGSYDLAKALQSGGKQAAGTTSFTEMTGQVVYDRGAVALRNVNIGAGALNAAASADIAAGGALSGRIVADAKVANRSQQATIVLGGTVKEPQVRN